jgi:hypothetical protein
METRAAEHVPKSPYMARDRSDGHPQSSRPSLRSVNEYDGKSQCSTTPSASPEYRRKVLTKPDRAVASRAASKHQPHPLKKERSSSTLRSYYDRTKSPLVVSQQTSASSARDFALRKGCPPVIPAMQRDASGPQHGEPSGYMTKLSKGGLKRRPSRLDLSMLFPKPAARAGPMLSPHRYTDSPPPLSVTSEAPLQEANIKPFCYQGHQSQMKDQELPRQAQGFDHLPRPIDPSFAKINIQKPRPGVQHWFDASEGNVSDEDGDGEPDMRPDFVETAFRMGSGTATPARACQIEKEPQRAPPRQVLDDDPFGPSLAIIAPKSRTPPNNQLREALHNWEVRSKSASGAKWNSAAHSQKSASTALKVANLNEESVLCLSSSEDDDENEKLPEPRLPLGQHGPFLRDSLGVDSIDSDVEIGTAKAINTSLLRSIKPLSQSSSLRDNSSVKAKSKVQRLKAVDIPDRRSSRQGVPKNEHQFLSTNSDDSTAKAFAIDSFDHDSISSKRSTRTAPAVSEKPPPLIMALTQQEASLLEALRSKRASMRQNILIEATRIGSDAGSCPRVTLSQPPNDHALTPRPNEYTSRLSDPDAAGVKKPSTARTASTEPSLTSNRVSLIFSESVSSPTTSRDSPATPTLDSIYDLNYLQGTGDLQNSGLHATRAKLFGHARCRTGSNQIAVDNFPIPNKEHMTCDEYPWAFGALTEKSNSAMIH